MFVLSATAGAAEEELPEKNWRDLFDVLRADVGERGVHPIAHRTTRARTSPFHGICLFASRESFTSSSGSSLYGLEGGAAIRILEQMDLTARFRMLGHDSNDVLLDLDSEIAAPLFGVSFRF